MPSCPRPLTVLATCGMTLQVAADSGNTSDPYAVLEIVDKGTGKRVGAKLQTGKQPKTLAPTWNEVKTWSGLKLPIDALNVRVAVFDKDTFSSTTLGAVEVPLSYFGGAEEPSWHALECAGKMKIVSGEVHLAVNIEVENPPGNGREMVEPAPLALPVPTAATTDATPAPISSEGARTPVDAATRAEAYAQTFVDSALRDALDARKAALLEQCELDSLTITVVAAEDLLAADKNGKSDPFCVVELIDAVDLKPLRGQSKFKTKCIKKTLNPDWNETKVWKNIKKPASAVVVRITVFDQDMFTSETIGTVSIPATQLADDSWVTLEKAKQMADVRGRVHLKNKLLVKAPALHSEDEPGTFTLELLGARRLEAKEGGETVGAFATAEILWESSGKPYFSEDGEKSSLRTKTIWKSSSPSWHAKRSWLGIVNTGEKLTVRVTVLRTGEGDLSSDVIGRAELPLSAFITTKAEPAFWHALETSAEAEESAVEIRAGDVEVRGRFYPCTDAAEQGTPSSSRQGSRPTSKEGSRPTSKSGRPRSQDGGSRISLSLTLVGARGLAAADKGGTSDPFAVAEIVLNGELAKNVGKMKTPVIKKTLDPSWNSEHAWVDIVEGLGDNMALRVTVFDKDIFSTQMLGIANIPLSLLESTPEGWFPLEKAKSMKISAETLGEVQLKSQVIRTDLPRSRPPSKGGKMTCTLTIVEATGLAAADDSGKSDPFATAELISKITNRAARGCSKFTTSTKKQTLDPSWQQMKVWKGIEDLPDALILRVRVFDSDLLSSTELGEIQIPLTTACNAGEMSYKLRATEKMKAKMTKAEGKVKLKASYSIMAGDGEKVVYVREAVWIGLRNFERHRRGALVDSPPSEQETVDILNELMTCDKHLYTVHDLDEDDIVNASLLLDFGILFGHSDLVEALQEGGFLREDGVDINGALRQTFQNTQPNVRIMKSLISAGANMSLQNKVGQTPLFWALETGNMDLVDVCFQNSATLSDACMVRADDKRSCLHVTAEQNMLATMKSLLKVDGIERIVNTQDRDGATPLFRALARGGGEQIALCLGSHGANADIAGPGNVLPLALALEEGQRAVLLHFLAAGADGSFKKKTGETALIDAVQRDDVAMLDKCLACNTLDVNSTEKAQTQSALIIAIMLPRPGMVDQLLAHPRIDPNVRHASRCTPLIHCVLKNDTRVFYALLDHPAIKIDARDSGLRTALSHAVALGQNDMALALISRGADVNLADGNGMPPLHHAQDEAMVLALVKNGAELDAVDKKGKSAVVWNVELGKESLVTYMMLLGADVDVKSKALEKASLFRPLEVRLRLLNVLIAQSKAPVQPEDERDMTSWVECVVGSWLAEAVDDTTGSAVHSATPKLDTPPITLAVEMEIIELLGTQAGRGTGHDELEFMIAIIDSGVIHVKRWFRHIRNCLLDPALSSIKMVEQLRLKARLDTLKGHCHTQKQLIQTKLDAIYEAKRYSRSLGRMTNQMHIENDMLRQDAEGLLPSVRSSDCNENGLIHLFQMLSLVLDERFHKDMNLRCLPENTTMDYKAGEPKTYDRIYARMLAEDIAKARPRCAANLDVLRSMATFRNAMSMAKAVRALTAKYQVVRIENSFARKHKSNETRGFRCIKVNFIWPTELTFGYLVKIHSRPSGKWSKYVRSVPKEQRREATGALKFLNSNSFRRRQINFIVEMQFTLQPFLELGRVQCYPYDKIIRAKDSREVAALFQPEIHLENVKNIEESLFLQVVVDELLEDADTYNRFKKLLFELNSGQTGAMTAILRGRAMLKKHPMLDSYFMAFVKTGSASGV
jgi:ankyrin repeat protein